MKGKANENVNIISLVDEFIGTLNKNCIIHKIPKVYEVILTDSMTRPTANEMKMGKTPKKCKRIALRMVHLETNERVELWSLEYVVKSAAALLTAPYKRTLYRELLYNALGTFAFNMESAIRADRVKAMPTTADMSRTPMTAKDAYKNIMTKPVAKPIDASRVVTPHKV